MKKLTILANNYRSDKGTVEGSCHAFSEIYDDYLSEIQSSCTHVLEVGVNDGSSLKMWYDYFPNAIIHGLDIDDKSQYNNDRIACGILDQSVEDHLVSFVNGIDTVYDFILDDGSHHMRDQQITFAHLFKLLKPGGIYVIEDLHTSLCDNGTNVYGRPIEIHNNNKNTTLEYLANKPHNSVYLTNEQNQYIQDNIDIVHIHRDHNDKVPSVYKQTSITSIITKKKD